MTEWSIVVVIIALVGLMATVAGLVGKITRPINDLTTTVTRLTGMVDTCEKDLSGIDRRNSETHALFFKELEAEKAVTQDHEVRIVKLEYGKEK